MRDEGCRWDNEIIVFTRSSSGNVQERGAADDVSRITTD